MFDIYFSYTLFIAGLLGITALFLYYRKERPMYFAAPIVFVGGIVLITISVSISCNANSSCNAEYIISYLLFQEYSTKEVSGRLYFGGYLFVWYAVVAMILYPFYRRKAK